MKKISVVYFMMLTLTIPIIAQNQTDLNSKISNVTVFSKGVQIENEAKVDLPKGKIILQLKNLSPYINSESVRIDGNGDFLILNVQLQNDYLNRLQKSKEINDLSVRIEQIQDKIDNETTGINICKEKLTFLKENRNISGKDQSINPETYKSLYQIYSDNTEKYILEIQKKERNIKDLSKEMDNLKNQLNTANEKDELPSGTISITVDSKKVQTSTLKISYIADKATWNPSYDIRFIDNNKPLAISYKANISQNTGTDWNEVSLKLSTAKTNISAQIPCLSTNYLHYLTPTEENSIGQALQGRVSGLSITNNTVPQSSQLFIRGANTLKKEAEPLYVIDGIVQKDVPELNPDDIESMNVLKNTSATAIYGSRGANGVILVTMKKNNGKSLIPTLTTENNETSNEYAVESLQTIKTDNKTNTLIFKESQLQASYEYQAVPKLSKNVYLIGKISDWHQADLMDGEANIYLGNSYVGKSRINTRQFSDTLDISFGIDNNIMVNREKVKDFTESQFLGANKKETYTWKITLRNNKSYEIKAKIIDQVPISSTKEIDVETLELSGGSMNQNTGKITWNVNLAPNEQKQWFLKYSVKYPKDRTVVVE